MTSASIDRRFGLTGNKAYKAPCALATTGNITLSGEQTIDGTLTSSSDVLVWQQTNPVENGIWVSSTGAWTRRADANTNQDLGKGTQVYVSGGTTYAGNRFAITANDPINPGTTSITISQTTDSSTLEARLASTASASDGDALIGVKRTEVSAVARLLHDHIQDMPVFASDFGAVGDGSDESAKLQAALNTGKTVWLQSGKTYNTGTTGIRIGTHNQKLRAHGATITYSGSGNAVDATLISGVYPQGVAIDDLNVDCTASCTGGISTRFSFSSFTNCFVGIRANNSVAWRIETDFTNGSGPYYNEFRNCHASGKVGITGGVTTQTGWLFTTSASAPTRGPNANTFVGGRTSNMSLPWVIAGAGNNVYAPKVEGTPSGGQVFTFENSHDPGPSASCINNVVHGGYTEGNPGANFVKFGTGAFYCFVQQPYVTSLGGGVYETNTSGNNTNGIWDSGGIQLGNEATARNVRSLGYYITDQIFTPTAYGSTTPGTQTYAIQKGVFQRIGTRVFFEISILMTAKDGATAGFVRLGPLPFAASSTADRYTSVAVGGCRATHSGGYTYMTARIDPGTDYITLVENGSGVAPALFPVTGMGATFELFVSGSYGV